MIHFDDENGLPITPPEYSARAVCPFVVAISLVVGLHKLVDKLSCYYMIL